MSDKEQNSGNWVDRRTVLKSTPAIVAGSAFAVAGAAKEPTVKEPLRVGEGEVVEYVEVPKKWHQYTNKVERVMEELRKEHSKDAGIISIHIGRGKGSTGGMRNTRVEATVNPDKYNGSLPDSKDGVDVKTEPTQNPQPAGIDGCHNEGLWANPPGAIQMWSEDTDGAGTSTWVFYEAGTTNRRMLSSGHVFNLCSRGLSNVKNDYMRINNDDERFGSVVDGDASQDWVATKENKVVENYTEEVVDETYGRIPIDGAIVNYDYYISEGKYVAQMGSETGRTGCQVTKSQVSLGTGTCVDLDGRGIKVESLSSVFGKGDSGGPIYDTFEDSDGIRKAAILGQAGWGANKVADGDCRGGGAIWNDCWGISSDAITDNGYDAPTN